MEPDNTAVAPQQQEQATPQVAKEQSHVGVIVLIILTLTVILAIVLLLFFFLRSHKDLLSAAQTTIQQQTSKQSPVQFQNNEIATATVTAKSLDVPPLYSQTDWEVVPAGSHDNTLATVVFVENSTNVPIVFNGKYWTAEVSNDTTMSVLQYYTTELKKEGWFGSSDSSIQHFGSFTLAGARATGQCNSVHSFLGYKDGLVRLIAIVTQSVPCGQNGSAYTSPVVDYSVFVSNPMKLSDIENYVKNKS